MIHVYEIGIYVIKEYAVYLHRETDFQKQCHKILGHNLVLELRWYM